MGMQLHHVDGGHPRPGDDVAGLGGHGGDSPAPVPSPRSSLLAPSHAPAPGLFDVGLGLVTRGRRKLLGLLRARTGVAR
jgi:hypothetical protein